MDFRYRIFNNTGDEVEHCGNGARCFARFVRDKGLITRDTIRVETVNNVLELRLQADGRVTVDMNAPLFEHAALPFDAAASTARRVGGFELWPLALDDGRTVEVAVLSMGNPHAVQRVDDVATRAGRRARPAGSSRTRAFRARSTPASCRCVRARRSRCASTSATPARRWPAAPAPAPRSSPGIRLGWLDRASTSTRAAAASPSNGRAASQRLHDRARRTVFEGE